MAPICRGVFTVTLTLFMFVCGALCFGIPPEFRANKGGRSLPLSFHPGVLRLGDDGRTTCNSGGEEGVCYDPLNCLRVAGMFGNNCPGSQSVCCLFYRQCGQRSSQEVSYFRSVDEIEGSGCNYRVVKRSPNYCQMRVKLEQLELPGDCKTSIHIEGISKGNSIGRLSYPDRQSVDPVDVICSTEAGKEYVFETRNIDEVRLNVDSSGGNSGRWKIKVTQVHCRDGNEVPTASEHSDHIPAVWPPPLPTHPPRPSRPTTAKPPISATCWWNCPVTGTTSSTTARIPMNPVGTGSSSTYSRCGVKGPNTRSFSFRTNRNTISDGESKPFIEDTEWGNPPRNDSEFADILRKWQAKQDEEDPFAIPGIKGKVTFGKPAGPREYPWQVGMKVRGRFHCGASIIGEQYILTAAHCVTKYRRSPQTLYLTLGDYDLSTTHEQKNIVPLVERVTVHPEYSRTTLRNDLAVLKLKEKIKFATNIRPVCLAPAGLDPTGKMAIVTGWGRDENNRLQSKLKELASEVDTNQYCGAQWEKNGAPRGFITKDMMCMSPIGGDSCNGDSGGPSVLEVGGTHYQVGIVSFGSGSCVDESLPGVYTRVTSYRDWIIQQMN